MKDTPRGEPDGEPDNDPPPILGTWRRAYVALLAYLAALILAFWLFAKAFAA